MIRKQLRSLLPLAAAAVLLVVLAGCGSDESGQTTDNAATAVSIQSPTSPLPTTTTSGTTTAAGPKKDKGQTTTTSGGSAPCTVPDAYQDFTHTGIDCTAAVALAEEWDRNGKDCNTVDNPNVDEGYNRTCEVEGFTCATKRDTRSDARFVTCTAGGQSVRFTWLPA
jgi:hypothetical protein